MRSAECLDIVLSAARVHPDTYDKVLPFFVRGIRNALFSVCPSDTDRYNADPSPPAAMRITQAIETVRAQLEEFRYDFAKGEVEKMVKDVRRSQRQGGA